MRSIAPRFTITASVEQVVVLTSVFWALTSNRPFLAMALNERSFGDPETWAFGGALLLMLAALNVLLLAPWAARWTLKPLLTLMFVATALTTHFMQAYGVYLDPTMVRNVLHTDVGEARELLTWSLLPTLLLHALLPLLLLWRVQLRRRASWGRAVAVRMLAMLLALGLLVGTLVAVFQPFASLMRNQRELRYLITPSNLVWSLGAALGARTRGAAQPRQPIGLDARPGGARRDRPLVVVMVVGETARAASWGLNGYARQTTPELAHLAATGALVNFTAATSCGTNTETSLPCMFAPVGRRNYDEARIRGSESLLHVLQRSGVAVHWRDNQSGCKGVCDGLPGGSFEAVAALNPAGLCAEGHCLDEGLLAGLDHRLAAWAREHRGQAPAARLLVLHPIGNHGPAYFRRYPRAFARFTPACERDDLRLCSQQEIVNAYDNALLYTDHVLASLVAKLQAAEHGVDSVLLYVSDHGESLGENNLYLHGLPYPIAPDVQKRVPLVLWLSAGAPRALALDVACLRRRGAAPAAHDHLFHTLLALLDVQTALYDPVWDLTQGCRHGDPR